MLKIQPLSLLFVAICTLVACAQSPTGRKQILLVNDSQMNAMGAKAYSDMKNKQPVISSSDPKSRYVRCIANAIVHELGGAQGQGWEVNLFAIKSPNAFALPGKKIGVNTGMLKVAKNQSQLAAVLGHEVGHVLAKHGAERVSLQMATQTGTQLLQAMTGTDSKTKQVAYALLGLGTKFGIALPYSRDHESEADLMGLKLMAKAGFDPQGSVQLWQNMSRMGGGSPPEFMSTHPAHSTRIHALQANMQEAMNLYQQAKAQGKRPHCG